MEENLNQDIVPVAPVEDIPTPPVNQPPFGSWWKVGGLVLGTVILVGGIFFAGYQYSQKQTTLVKYPINVPTATPTQAQTILTPIPTLKISPTPTIQQADSKKTVIVPYPLVDTSGWQSKVLPKLKITLSIPQAWKIISETGNAVSFETGPAARSLSIILDQNSKNYGRRDFIWKQTLGMTSDLTEAIKAGSVDSPKEWLIDGIPSLSLLYRRNPSYPGEFSDTLVIPVGSQMIILNVWGREFSTKDSELFTVLSTAKVSR